MQIVPLRSLFTTLTWSAVSPIVSSRYFPRMYHESCHSTTRLKMGIECCLQRRLNRNKNALTPTTPGYTITAFTPANPFRLSQAILLSFNER